MIETAVCVGKSAVSETASGRRSRRRRHMTAGSAVTGGLPETAENSGKARKIGEFFKKKLLTRKREHNIIYICDIG